MLEQVTSQGTVAVGKAMLSRIISEGIVGCGEEHVGTATPRVTVAVHKSMPAAGISLERLWLHLELQQP